MKRLHVFLLVFFGFSPLVVSPALAQGPAACSGGVDTALGCLHIDLANPTSALTEILGWSISVGGGIAFLLTLYAGFQLSTAQGDPKKMQAAQELLTSAISGLILIVFSIVILNVIGDTILNLPGFKL